MRLIQRWPKLIGNSAKIVFKKQDEIKSRSEQNSSLGLIKDEGIYTYLPESLLTTK